MEDIELTAMSAESTLESKNEEEAQKASVGINSDLCRHFSPYRC